MNALLPDALDYLRALAMETIDTDGALARLRPLRAAHPQVRLELLWERRVDDSLHYELLAETADGATACLSFVPPSTTPFPLQAAQPWREAQLATIDGRPLFVQTVMRSLDMFWSGVGLLDGIVEGQLIARLLESQPVHVEDEALQAAMDRFRTERGLNGPSATEQWLEERSMTLVDLEHELERGLARDRLRSRLVGEEAAAAFAADPRGHDAVAVVAFPVADLDVAHACVARIEAGESLLEVAEDVIADADASARAARSVVFETFPRARIEPLGAAVLDEEAVLVAMLAGRGPYVLRVRRVDAAEWNDETRTAIEEDLFAAYLSRARTNADVHWHWGPASDQSG